MLHLTIKMITKRGFHNEAKCSNVEIGRDVRNAIFKRTRNVFDLRSLKRDDVCDDVNNSTTVKHDCFDGFRWLVWQLFMNRVLEPEPES